MSERRRRQRLPWIKMEARIRVRKNFLASGWEDVTVVDFNKLGIGIVTQRSLSQDESLVLSLRLSTEVGDIVVDKVGALVRHTEDHELGRRFGLEFESELSDEVVRGLTRIEKLLSRYAQVTDRMR